MLAAEKVHVTFDESKSLVELSFSAPGENDDEHNEMALAMKAHFDNLVTTHPDAKFKVLVDLTNAGIPTKHATDLYISTLSDKRVAKTAFFGVSKTIESIINFIVGASGRGLETRFFINKEEAYNWLAQ